MSYKCIITLSLAVVVILAVTMNCSIKKATEDTTVEAKIKDHSSIINKWRISQIIVIIKIKITIDIQWFMK